MSSWIDTAGNKVIITTGDGEVYNVDWLPGTKSAEYNLANFEFLDVKGTLIKKEQPKGASYELIILFQGEDNLVLSERFQKSCEDKNPVTINHPVYGVMVVQITGLAIDNTKFNVTTIKIDCQETIADINPKLKENPIDAIQGKKAELKNLTVETSLASFSTAEQASLQLDVVDLFNQTYAGIILLDSEKEKLLTLVREARLASVNALSDPADAISKTVDLINFPFEIKQEVSTLVNVISQSLTNLLLIPFDNKFNKQLYEMNGLSLMGTLCAVTIKLEEEVSLTAKSILTLLSGILDVYSNFLTKIDENQSVRSDTYNSYTPLYGSMKELEELMALTVSNLFHLSYNAKQERIVILDKDSNIINLVDQLYGLSDDTLEQFMEINSISLSEMLQLKKGREITYLV